MIELYHGTEGSDWLTSSKLATNGAATSVYKCMSRPSNSQPSQAARPDFHCSEVRSRSLVISGGPDGAGDWCGRSVATAVRSSGVISRFEGLFRCSQSQQPTYASCSPAG